MSAARFRRRALARRLREHLPARGPIFPALLARRAGMTLADTLTGLHELRHQRVVTFDTGRDRWAIRPADRKDHAA